MTNSCQLVALPDPVLWTSRTWTDFAELPAPAKHIVVLPLFGLGDWGLGRPLDLEETLGTAVLHEALATTAAKKLPLIVLPPLRWVLGPYPHSVFGVDFETAYDLLREIATFVKAAGFRKLVLFNTSPWNEELIDAGGRDVRVDLGLQVFCVNLAALDFDLHPVRSSSRADVQCAACAAYAAPPANETVAADVSWADFRPGNIRQPGPLAFDLSFKEAKSQGEKRLAAAGRRLAALFGEIHARRPLAADGAIPRRTKSKTQPSPKRKTARKRR